MPLLLRHPGAFLRTLAPSRCIMMRVVYDTLPTAGSFWYILGWCTEIKFGVLTSPNCSRLLSYNVLLYLIMLYAVAADASRCTPVYAGPSQCSIVHSICLLLEIPGSYWYIIWWWTDAKYLVVWTTITTTVAGCYCSHRCSHSIFFRSAASVTRTLQVPRLVLLILLMLLLFRRQYKQ